MHNFTLIKIFTLTSNFVLNEELANVIKKDYVEHFYQSCIDKGHLTADDCSCDDFLNYVCCFVSLFSHLGYYDI